MDPPPFPYKCYVKVQLCNHSLYGSVVWLQQVQSDADTHGEEPQILS